jgi:hypothetical protein
MTTRALSLGVRVALEHQDRQPFGRRIVGAFERRNRAQPGVFDPQFFLEGLDVLAQPVDLGGHLRSGVGAVLEASAHLAEGQPLETDGMEQGLLDLPAPLLRERDEQSRHRSTIFVSARGVNSRSGKHAAADFPFSTKRRPVIKWRVARPCQRAAAQPLPRRGRDFRPNAFDD